MDEHERLCSQLSTVSPLTIVGDDEEVAEKRMEEVSCDASNDTRIHPQKKKKRPKWKKPAGKPHHPRTGYNLFFRFERERILNQMDHVPITLSIVQSIQVNSIPNIKESAHTIRLRTPSMPGNVGFAGLTRDVAAKWKSLDPKIKDIFERKAAEDKERYKRELEVWQQKEKEKEENASSGQGSPASFSKNLPVFHMESTEIPSQHHPMLYFASSENRTMTNQVADPFVPWNFSSDMSEAAGNDHFDFPNNLNQHFLYPSEVKGQETSRTQLEIVNQQEHGFPDFPHNPINPFSGEVQRSIVTPSYSRSSESSFPSSTFDDHSDTGRTNGILSSTIGHFTGEVQNLSSRLEKWMQEEFASSDQLTIQQRQDLEHQMMTCSDNVRQLLLQLRALNAPLSIPEEEPRPRESCPVLPGTTKGFEHRPIPREGGYGGDSSAQSMNHHLNQFADSKYGFEEGYASRSLHEIAFVDCQAQRRRSLVPVYPRMKDACATSRGDLLSLRKALEVSPSLCAHGYVSPSSDFPTARVDPGELFQRTRSDPTGCHSFTPPPYRYSATIHPMQRHHTLDHTTLPANKARCLGSQKFDDSEFMSDMNQMPMTLEEERFTSPAVDNPSRFNSGEFDFFPDDMAANRDDFDNTI